jgi:hypothetical protein
MLTHEIIVFNDEEIRDTSEHTSSLADNRGYTLKTIIIENGLNQTVTFECWASRNGDFSNSFQVGSSWDVSASTNTYQTSDSYFPYMKIKAQCSTAPTSGDLTVAFEEIGER